jgi:hypothetical protein
MQQFDKQIRVRFKKLFADGLPIDGKPTVGQRRKFLQKNFEQNSKLLEIITNYDYQKINYISSLSLAEVYRILENFLSKEPKK